MFEWEGQMNTWLFCSNHWLYCCCLSSWRQLSFTARIKKIENPHYQTNKQKKKHPPNPKAMLFALNASQRLGQGYGWEGSPYVVDSRVRRKLTAEEMEKINSFNPIRLWTASWSCVDPKAARTARTVLAAGPAEPEGCPQPCTGQPKAQTGFGNWHVGSLAGLGSSSTQKGHSSCCQEVSISPGCWGTLVWQTCSDCDPALPCMAWPCSSSPFCG